MERLHGDIRDFKNYDFELNEKDTKELHRNITIKSSVMKCYRCCNT